MKKRRRAGMPAWLKWMVVGAALVTLLPVTIFAVLTANAMVDFMFTAPINPAESAENPSGNALQPVIADLLPPIVTIEAIDDEEAATIPTAEPLPMLDSDERVTILVMGLDRRTGESVVSRTDTMILLSIDPANGSASMLSVPRDLYVDIPTYYRRERINTAFFLGALNNGEEGGAKLAMQTIEHNLGIPVDHYLLVDFDTVIDLVDEAGGVMVDVPYAIYDPLYPDMNYGYDPFYIEAGEQTLDGETALKYMRTRHSDNDFGRSRRQQQVLMALRDQMLSDGIAGILRRAPSLMQEMQAGFFTDMSVNDIIGIANTASGISAENIETGVLDYNYVYSHTTRNGASVLILRTIPVTELVQTLFD